MFFSDKGVLVSMILKSGLMFEFKLLYLLFKGEVSSSLRLYSKTSYQPILLK